jgi:molecular chaperone GrpE
MTFWKKTEPMQNPTPDSNNAPNANGEAPFEAAPAHAPTTPDPRIAELEALVETLKSEKLSALAEAENAGKRADKRIADNAKYAVSNIAKALLAVADNLGRALMAAPAESRAANEALKNLATGVELTSKELETVLENQGVRKMNALNQPFDANFHNAIQEVENATVPASTVVQVFQDGYMIHDRLLRPAMVVISKGGPKRAAANGAGGVNTSA